MHEVKLTEYTRWLMKSADVLD